MERDFKMTAITMAGLEEVLADLQSKQGIVPEGPELASLAIRKNVEIPSGHTFNTKDVNSFLKANYVF